ncbi:hypothetical protein [Lutispora sp.]|uniref:hypothetical protein n=1 Tax=Lutispora sp. TaxID=2828727 RepID=UPI002B1F0314|nr:hypothetical protein [Lutispora sp.]MEA4962104.1 hypothetical protein [Lutispora sp.]
MNTVKDWIRILEENQECPACGSEDVIPVITPHPYKFTSAIFIKANDQRGIMICCNDCGAVATLTAEELEK